MSLFKSTLSRAGSLPPDTIILYASINKDGAGKAFVPRQALSLVAKASNAPVFGVPDSYLGFGIIGGYLMSFTEHGREAAALTLRVMAGESPASIPFGGDQAYITAYDWRELARWGLSERNLPPGSSVEFKSYSLWEKYKCKIITGLFFIVIESLLIIGLFLNLYKRRRAETEIAASALRYRTVADYPRLGVLVGT